MHFRCLICCSRDHQTAATAAAPTADMARFPRKLVFHHNSSSYTAANYNATTHALMHSCTLHALLRSRVQYHSQTLCKAWCALHYKLDRIFSIDFQQSQLFYGSCITQDNLAIAILHDSISCIFLIVYFFCG